MQNKGFSLIELVVVISIIAVLSVLGISTYSAVQVDARNSKRKADLKDMRDALEIFRNENDHYPITFPVGGTRVWSGNCNPNPWGPSPAVYIPGLAPDFMDSLPRDPRENTTNASSGATGCTTTANGNCYLYASDGVDFKLLAHCTPEGPMDPNDPFFDVIRPTHAWQVSSSATSSRNW